MSSGVSKILAHGTCFMVISSAQIPNAHVSCAKVEFEAIAHADVSASLFPLEAASDAAFIA
jgi:hypothetical protein